MLYLFSFKKLENPILLSKERNIYLKNIDNLFEFDFFVNNFFRYQVSKIWIIPDYFSKNNWLNSIIKIDNWLNFEEYAKNRFSLDKEQRDSKEIDEKIIIENHNIFNVILFSLSLIMYNQDLIDNNIYLQNLDSNKYSKLENKINVNWISDILNPYLDFSIIEKDLIEIFWFFDFNYKKYNLEDFIYIWELLNLYNSTKSKYFRFTQLVSIIEFLLIKWERDLTKQFKLKTWIIIERLIKLNQILDKKHFQLILFDNKEIIVDLDCIYDIRSSIVHWSLKEIDSKIWNYKKNYNDNMKELINFDFYFRELQNITAGILYLYIQEPDYIKFLKEN